MPAVLGHGREHADPRVGDELATRWVGVWSGHGPAVPRAQPGEPGATRKGESPSTRIGYQRSMKVVVTGATGNLGSASVAALSSAGHDVVGVARRSPMATGGARGVGHLARARSSRDDLAAVVDADAVVHLAWRFQPTRDPEVTWQTNAVGTHRLLDAVTAAGTSAVVCASSIAAYSPMTDDQPVDESWPTDGTSAAAYCREKAYVERLLDAFEQRSPAARVVRLRPAFVFQRVAASEQRRIFGGPLARPSLFGRGRAARRTVPGRSPDAGRARRRRRRGRRGGGGTGLPRTGRTSPDLAGSAPTRWAG